MHRYLLIAVLMFAIGPASASAQRPQAGADFGRLVHPANQLGFMHGAVGAYWNTSSNQAVEERAKLLMPSIWRGINASWSINPQVVARTGATPIYNLSSAWLSAITNKRKGCIGLFWDRPLPFQNWKVWKTWVIGQADRLAKINPSGPVWIDIWNEPDHPKFWPVVRKDQCYSKSIVDRDGSKWLQTFLFTERLLRARLGSRARILGPSVAGNAMLWSNRLVAYCAKHHCRLDGLAWHICGGGQNAINQIPAYTRRAKQLMKSNAAWKKVLGANGRILMTEYTSRSLHLRPGALVAYWYSLERSPVSASALSNWNDPDGSKLAGLLTPQGDPKPLWWSARAYALGRASRVSSFTNNGYWSVIAARQGVTGGPEFLLGNNYSKAAKVKITLRRLNALGFKRKMRLGVIDLPVSRSGAAMMHLPRPSWKGWFAIRRGTATVMLSPRTGHALLVSIAGY